MNPVYRRLSGVKLLSKSYTFKFLFIAFLGIHVPLLGLIVFIISKPGLISPAGVFIVTLLLTLAATVVTLLILKGLLTPLHACKAALERYLRDKTVPSLPINYKDEAGILMSKVQETVVSLDTLLEEKKDLIALLSHDLRTPLASILLLSEALEKDDDLTIQERKDAASLISESAKEQMQLFQKILEILRHDDINRFHLELNQVPVKTIVEASINDIKPLADRKNVEILVMCPENLEINVDKKLIAQVVKNLLSNAIKFSHKDSRISVCVERLSGRVHLNVSDSGLGFHPSDKHKIFQRFTSVRKIGTGSEVSTGMGLYLSSKIVKAHQGSLSAESEGLERGATFTLELQAAA